MISIQIESKFDVEQAWNVKKQGGSNRKIQTLLNVESKKRKATSEPTSNESIAPAPKKTKTSTKKQKGNGKSTKQATIFDHFKPKQEVKHEANGEVKPVYAQKLLDMVELVKSLAADRDNRFRL